MKKTDILLVGIGGYGSLYVNELLKPENRETLNLVGTVDPYPASCGRLDEIVAMSGRPYRTIEEFYSEHTADLAVISTPIQFHREGILTALSHGSDVLCEKPLSGDVRDIETLLDAEASSGCHVHIGYQWSHSEAILSLKRDIMAGLYGKPDILKTLILWPRDKKYFTRGTGWAGKIRASDGTLIYDSVANNAAAHYLHNMLYVTGSEINASSHAENISAKLYRVNSIENFDTAIIKFGLSCGGRCVFIASHTIDRAQNPLFDYKFTEGRVTYTEDALTDKISGKDDYTVGHITGTDKFGVLHDYGDPFYKVERKLYNAVDTRNGKAGANVVCGIKAASEHTRLINEIGENFPIGSFPADKIRERSELLYVDGLSDELTEEYNKIK
ncbi:MAG: Gfo/Idh/MocA family oxidoreductase [Firmicutes bacterium]|nr:Gfo/Idh/MocA family oxidoreductase [Bacillota bacterium]